MPEIKGLAFTFAVKGTNFLVIMYSAYTEGGLELTEFKELKNPLIAEKASLEQQIVTAQGGGANRLAPLKNWILKANAAEK